MSTLISRWFGSIAFKKSSYRVWFNHVEDKKAKNKNKKNQPTGKQLIKNNNMTYWWLYCLLTTLYETQ